MGTLDSTAGRWSRTLRLLHLLLAIAVTAQLFIGSFMGSPHTGRPDTFGFESHEVLGFTILALVLLHWLWSFTHPIEGLGHLFPWTRKGLSRVIAQFWQAIRYRQLPSSGPDVDSGLAGFTHGLGLLAVTSMAFTGCIFYLSRMAGASHGILEIIEDVHDTLAVVTWVYWGGHLAVTLLHSLLRHPTFIRMFNLFD